MGNHVSEITEIDKDEYLDHLRDGLDAASAASLCGFTGTQFRKLRRQHSQWYDPDFAAACDEAERSEDRQRTQRERLEAAFWLQVEKGNWNAIFKGLVLMHPEWEPLRHSNLRVSGQIEHVARLIQELPHLTDEQLQRLADSDEPLALLEAGSGD